MTIDAELKLIETLIGRAHRALSIGQPNHVIRALGYKAVHRQIDQMLIRVDRESAP